MSPSTHIDSTIASRPPAPPVDGAQLTFGFCIPVARCAHLDIDLRWREMAHGRAHLGRYCQGCGAWLGWVPQNGVTLRLAPPRPEDAP